MNVLLTHPFCWPYVRRGTERNLDVWFRHLAARGYSVKMLSTCPEDGAMDGDPAKVLERAIDNPLLRALRLSPTHTFFWNVWRALPKLPVNVVHSYHFYDSLAAGTKRRLTGQRYGLVMQMNGVPVPGVSCRRFLPPEGYLTRQAIHSADRRIACSQFVAELIERVYGAESTVIAPPLDRSLWPCGTVERADPPVVLAVANFNERRKGLRVVVKAFELLRHELPEARLWLSGYLSAENEAEVLGRLPAELRQSITVFGIGKSEDLPALYQQASALVLASMWEPSGTVMMEAWLSGTPVAATRHAGLPEFFGDGVGYMFDPKGDGEETHNAEGLATALFDTIRLSREPGIRERCRRHGETFTAEAVGPRYEEIYREVACGG
jgi:glycosyltransferase involved in cell wall biosynthesis